MVRKAATPAELVANLHRRASELESKIGKGLVAQAMKLHPWAIAELVSKLEGLELITVNETGGKIVKIPEKITAAPLSFQAQAVADRRSPMKQQKALTNGDDAASDIPECDQIPSKYWSLDQLSPSLMSTKLLSSLEPAALSTHNLKLINVKGKTLWNRQQHMRLFEFLTGMTPDSGLAGMMRSWPHLQQLAIARNEARGRRGRDITLPCDFDQPSLGLYRIIPQDGAIEVHHRFTSAVKAFAVDECPPFTTPDDLHIDQSWSELRAALASKEDVLNLKSVLLLPHFPQQSLLAIKDDTCDTDSGSAKEKSEPKGKDDPPTTPKKAGEKRPRGKQAGAAFIQKLAKKAKHSA